MPHFWEVRTQGGYDPQIQTRPRFVYIAFVSQVASSYVYSFGSYRVDKHTNKMPLKTPNWGLHSRAPISQVPGNPGHFPFPNSREWNCLIPDENGNGAADGIAVI